MGSPNTTATQGSNDGLNTATTSVATTTLVDVDLLDKVVKRQRTLAKSTSDGIDKLIQHLQQTKTVLSQSQRTQNGDLTKTALSSLAKKLTTTTDEMNASVKDYYTALNKFSKALDKRFTLNLDLAAYPDAFEGKQHLLDQAIAMHFIREGHFDVGDLFCTESNTILPENVRSQFSAMYDILQSLRQHDLSKALSWARSHRGSLDARGSHLEFQLHRMHFLNQLLQAGTLTDHQQRRQCLLASMAYAKQEFSWFGDKHLKDIQRLMGCILFAGSLSPSTHSVSLAKSPYADLVEVDMWEQIEQHFTREYCTLMGMSADPPLMVAVNCGAAAIPTVIKVRNVMDERRKERPKVEMWTLADELPAEIPLAKQYRYHSVFACPVSKEQTSETNPAMMLPCGHILCRESLIRLSKNKTGPGQPQPQPGQLNPQAKVKCPYCPNESTAGQAVKVLF